MNDLLGKSWILINTSTREGLSNSFLEAAAHGCAILSSVNPDNIVSSYGFHVKDDNFCESLQFLLQDNHWQRLGELGRLKMIHTFGVEKAIDKHLLIYQEIMS